MSLLAAAGTGARAGCDRALGAARPNILICRSWRVHGLTGYGVRGQCLGMVNLPDVAPVPSDRPAPFADQLHLAVAAYLARFTALIKTRLRRMHRRPGLLGGFLASTGLDLTPFCNPRN